MRKAGMKLDPAAVKELVRRALEEDIGPGDITTAALVPPEEEVSAEIVAGEPLVVAGLPVAAEVFAQLDARVVFEPLLADGSAVSAGARVAVVSGPAAPILTGERTALNFLQRLSGVATLTRRFVERAEGGPPRSSTRARPRRGCATSRSTPWPRAAARTTGWACTTGSSSRTTTSAS